MQNQQTLALNIHILQETQRLLNPMQRKEATGELSVT